MYLKVFAPPYQNKCLTKNLGCMNKLKEISEKSEGRVIIATLPKTEFTEPIEKGKEKKEPTAPAKPQEKHQAPKAQEQPQKSLAEMQADFERLRNLFHRKSRFENAISKLKDYGKNLAESGEEIESEGFKLILGSGYNREDVKISNVVVISDCIKFLLARIETTIEGIEAEILKG